MQVMLILEGGPIHTVDPELGTVEALGISDGRVVAAGSSAAVRQALGPGAEVVDLDGRTVLPGLIDTHPHLLHFALMAAPLVDITAARDHAEIVARIAARAAETPPGEWIMTTPVGEPHFFVTRSWRDLREGRLPDRTSLDRASERHPVMIQAWAPQTPNVLAFNSRALERLGIDATSPDRVGEVWIEKDSGGNPTGILTGSVTNYYSSDAFNRSLWAQVPFLQLERAGEATVRAMAEYNAQGVTAIYENHGMEPAHIAGWSALRSAGLLTLRVAVAQELESYGMAWSETKSDEEFLRDLELAAGAIELDDELLRFLGVTFMRDGSCWPGTIRMREPYWGPYGEKTEGFEYIARSRAAEAIDWCASSGILLNTVVMGTRAHEENLEQLEAAARRFDLPALNWLLVHSWFLEESQARRYARLGMDVTTSMAFCWGKGRLFRERMGRHVMADLVPLRRMLDAGLVVAGGSDWGPKSAFRQIELALTHAVAGSDEPNLGRAQRINRHEALEMWTRSAARVLRWTDIGALAPGNHADLIVVDRDPMSCSVEDIGATIVTATLLGGRPVFGELV